MTRTGRTASTAGVDRGTARRPARGKPPVGGRVTAACAGNRAGVPRKTKNNEPDAPGPTDTAVTPDAPAPIEQEIAEVDARDPDVAEEIRRVVADAPDANGAAPEGAASSMTDVTFSLPAAEWIDRAVLAGDFNLWSLQAHPMVREGDRFTVTVPLERDRRYRYRFVVNDVDWVNDPSADAYEPNDHGSDDCVRCT